MNRAEKRKLARKNKKQKHTILIVVAQDENGLTEVNSNSGRTILIKDTSQYGIDLGLCLDQTLTEFGDISGVNGKAKVVLRLENGLPQIQVDRDCYFEGYYNGFSGKLSAQACGLALGITLCSHFSAYISKFEPEIAERLSKHYHNLRDQAFTNLSKADQCELWKFLD